ncbi:uncharacterized protein LOC119671650 [Teleopsis dalmanni]|uniref:uncharacterized protein LOC119671650 n=1 Tax=Teleopsis dalmanni TaxID=139649 RepID=UPI0018CF1962|nr:uncharacterized protein LOC119671650 [Teleopsis dalmanni]
MKFFTFAFIASLCFVAVYSSSAVVEEPIDISLESLESLDFDIDFYGEDRGFYGTLKKILRGVKGLNCLIKAVLNIQNVTETFLTDVKACGGNVSKQLKAVIDACNDIIKTTNEILNLNDTICNNSEDSHLDEDATNSKKCIVKVAKKIVTLNKQIKKAIKLIKKVPQAPGDAGKCVNDALDELQNYFVQFKPAVIECSKLTS